MTMAVNIISAYVFIMLLRMLYSLCAGFLYIKPRTFSKNYKPLVSVIIPALNEECGIQKTIRSVMSNSYKNIEIIVINDGSTDATLNMTEEIKNRYPKNGSTIKIISQPNQGKASALNNGIKASQGEIIVTIDADSYIAKSALKKLVACLGSKEYDVAIGQIVVGNTKTLVGTIQFFEYLFGFHFKRSQHIFGSIFIFPGALTAVRKELIEEVGYFEDYSSTEDLDLSMKVKAGGHKVGYVEDAVCVTEGASDIRGLINQRTRWRHGFLQCALRRNDFTRKSNKGLYLSFVDFPLALLGVLEIYLYPLFLVFIYSQIFFAVVSGNVAVVLISYLLLPYVFFMLSEGRLKKNDKSLKYVVLIPVLFSFVNMIEFIALIKATYRMLTRRKTAWTRWQRSGA